MNSRREIFKVVAEQIVIREQLKPFLPAWSAIADIFDGVSDICIDLDPVFFVHKKLTVEIERNNIITEEDFLLWLVSLPVLKVNITDENGHLFSPLHQKFSEFSSGKELKKFKSTNRFNDKNEIDNFSIWLIQKCDWSSCSVKSANLH